jgi:hypothetical protein
MSSSRLLLGLLALTSSAGLAAADTLPAESFGPDIAEHSRAGWRLAALDLNADYDTERVVFTVTMTSGKQAIDFRLSTEELGMKLTGYERVTGTAPAEERVYRNTAELLAAFAKGPVSFEEPCGTYYMNTGTTGATFDPNDYYIVVRRVDGAAAGVELSRALTQALDAKMTLSDVRKDGRELHFTLVAADQEDLVVRVDSTGRVMALEIRHSPQSYGGGEYPYGKWLALKLRNHAVTSVQHKDGKVTFSLEDASVHTVSLDKIVYQDECGC